MKKILFLGIVSTLLFYSCASTVNKSSQSTVSGTWSLDNVSYSESGVKVKAFGMFDAQCLVSSTWYFIANNNSGDFNMSGGGDCPSLAQNFKWYIDPQNMFVLKPLNDGDKAKKITIGTTYQYQGVTDSSFNLTQVVDGVSITYHFTKLSSGRLK